MKVEDALITQGWTQNKYRDDVTGEVCFFGAIFYSRFGTWDDWASWEDGDNWHEDEDLLRRVNSGEMALKELGEPTIDADLEMCGLVMFNDWPERTKDEILALARRADEIYADRTITFVHPR